MEIKTIKQVINSGDTSLGIEFGSTRIKAILIGPNHTPLAAGSYDWENQFHDGVWTYSLDAISHGLQGCYRKLKEDVLSQYSIELKTFGSIGISGMMHGYMVFDKNDKLLTPFRTWRNTNTFNACERLVQLFGYPIPHRWSIAHLYQAILDAEEHVPDISFITTLAGYVHWQLTGEKVLGICDASGMFPIDIGTKHFDQRMMDQFDLLVSDKALAWQLSDILPTILLAGDKAGSLTNGGAKLLDPSGSLEPGIPFCPPEGDAGTGMVATNSIARRSGNVSAGTSMFLMAVLEEELKKVHSEIDLLTTPVGDLVAMVHANNGCGDIDAWLKIFSELLDSLEINISKSELYDTLYYLALAADSDCGGLLSYNYISGESITGMKKGSPLFVRTSEAKFSLANFMRMQLYSALTTLRIGFDILCDDENVELDRLYGHGGFFKTEKVGQTIMAAALHTPVSVLETASEGGPWGMALLAAYMRERNSEESLESYLNRIVFSDLKDNTINPDSEDVKGFERYLQLYKSGLPLEYMASELSV